MILSEEQHLRWEENNSDDSLPDRLLSKIDFGGPEECWIWRASKDRDGYGRIRLMGVPTLAHRLMFEIFIRRPGKSEVVMHSCDNPSCVNPGHLSAGSQADNIADRHRKGRTVLPVSVPRTVPEAKI